MSPMDTSVYLNIGSLIPSNQNKDVWKVDRAKYLRVPNGESYIVKSSLDFMEEQHFEQSGEIIIHGNILEYDSASTSDRIGSINGEVYEAKSILDRKVTKIQYGDKDSYVKITLELTKL